MLEKTLNAKPCGGYSSYGSTFQSLGFMTDGLAFRVWDFWFDV